MKKLKFLVFVIPFLFGFNVFAWDSISGSSYGYDEYTGVCQANSFYYILDNNLAQQGFGTFAYSYTNGNFARVRADINYQLLPNTTYDLTFSNPLHEYGSNPTYAWTAITTSSVSINIINGCGGTIMRPVSVSSVSYPDSTAYDRDYVTIRFTTSDYVAKPWFSVDLQSGYTSQGIYQITTGGQARLDNIYLSIVTGDDSGGSSSNQDIINNQTNNTNNIINNQNSNTQEIIDNQNQNTQQQIESQKVCSDILIDNSFIKTHGQYINTSSGNIYNGTAQGISDGITDYISITSSDVLTGLSSVSWSYSCFYDELKNVISCFSNNFAANSIIPIPSNAKFVRFSIHESLNRPRFNLHQCKNGNQALDDTLTDDSVDNNTGTSFFDNFTDQDFGLSQIITIPLSTIQSLTSKQCVVIDIPIPFTNRNVQLPCMIEIYNKFPTLFNLWKIVSFGIISYFICIDIFHIVKGFKDPESDKVEVLDL